MTRLAALESWLWDQGPRLLGLRAAPRPEMIARRVVALSDIYTTSREALPLQADDPTHLQAKFFYFLASDAPKLHLILDEVARRHGGPFHRPGTPRVLDAGAGVGATTAGLLLSLDARTVPRVEVHAADADARTQRVWLGVARRCAAIVGVQIETRATAADLRDPAAVEPAPGWDLVVAQSLLNELSDSPADSFEETVARRAAWVGHWATRGLTIIIEPALRVTTRPLQAVRDRLVGGGGVRVLAPCPHQMACPMLPNERDWCHELRSVPPSPAVAEIQKITRRRNERTKFSFVALAPAAAAAALPAPLLPGLTGRIVSDALPSKGKLERWLCQSDGQLVRLRLLDKDRTPENERLATADRGTILRLEGAAELPRLSKETVVCEG